MYKINIYNKMYKSYFVFPLLLLINILLYLLAVIFIVYVRK